MFLGFDQKSGLFYEGIDAPELPAIPHPIVTPAKLIRGDGDWRNLPSRITETPMPWVFREDTFDPVTRTRRGRLYEPAQQQQPSAQRIVPHPYEDPAMRTMGAGGRNGKQLHVYKACEPLLSEPRRGEGSKLALGTARAASAWRIIQTEVLASGNVMVTLKSLSAFGIMPDIDAEKVPEEFQKPVTDAVDRVLNSAFRETPISVIDHCRNAMTMLVSCWIAAQGDRSILGKDLGDVAKAVAKPPYEKGCISSLAQVIARLHSRGKGNEEHARGLRVPVEEDAELALHALGLALRDIGWAA